MRVTAHASGPSGGRCQTCKRSTPYCDTCLGLARGLSASSGYSTQSRTEAYYRVGDENVTVLHTVMQVQVRSALRACPRACKQERCVVCAGCCECCSFSVQPVNSYKCMQHPASASHSQGHCMLSPSKTRQNLKYFAAAHLPSRTSLRAFSL
jgi:hypothetical protein